ncbi:hypothetical protein HAX54_000710, partial [Datura stramonium]|nr:hypothetical protein [Datura stramonium]
WVRPSRPLSGVTQYGSHGLNMVKLNTAFTASIWSFHTSYRPYGHGPRSNNIQQPKRRKENPIKLG